VIAVPEISRLPLSQEDEFIIVASDGVWGRLGNQQAVDIVRGVLLGSGAGPDAADEVADAAQAGEQDAGDQLPPLPRPSLAHDHSLVRPSGSALPLAANPVQSTLAAAANAPTRSALFSPRVAASSFATPSSMPTSISRSLLAESSASSVSGASGLLTGRSSMRLTSPTAALRLAHQDSVHSHADVDTVPAGQVTDVAMAIPLRPLTHRPIPAAAVASTHLLRRKLERFGHLGWRAQ